MRYGLFSGEKKGRVGSACTGERPGRSPACILQEGGRLVYRTKLVYWHRDFNWRTETELNSLSQRNDLMALHRLSM